MQKHKSKSAGSEQKGQAAKSDGSLHDPANRTPGDDLLEQNGQPAPMQPGREARRDGLRGEEEE